MDAAVVLALFVLAACAAFPVVVWSTARKRGRWGINLKGLRGMPCPSCGVASPKVRVPASWRQALWGGWTCACGTSMDKWGREVPHR